MSYSALFDDIAGAPAVLIANEKVICSNAITIDGDTYYWGRLIGFPAPSLLFGSQTTQGAWTAASKAGTRYTLSDSSLPGANEALVDYVNGRIITSASVTLYFHYYDYGRVFKDYELGPPLTIYLPEFLDAGSETLLYRMFIRQKTRFVAGQITNPFVTSDATVAFILKNATASTTVTFTIASGAQSQITEFTDGLLFDKGDVLEVRVPTNTAGLHSVTILLYPG